MNKILIVDDEKIVCAGLAKQLKMKGYDCEWSLNGFDGTEKIKSDGYALAFIDFILPDGNGVEVCKKIKAIDDSIVTVLMSGDEDLLLKSRDENLGSNLFQEYLSKPFSGEELLGVKKYL